MASPLSSDPTVAGENASVVVNAPEAGTAASLAKRLWDESKKEALLSMYSPFVVCLASGALDVGVFRHYIAQDVHFLQAFARGYEMAGECASDDFKGTLAELRSAVLEELMMHNSFVEEWGVDLSKEITPNPATVKYTDFLLATAEGKIDGVESSSNFASSIEKEEIAAYTVGAMTPCMRLYAFLGKGLQKYLLPDYSSHPYKNWIETYSSTSFEASALQIEELLDRLSFSLNDNELDVIKELYVQAMRLEFEFFQAQPIVQQSVVPLTRYADQMENRLVVCSYFDLTCTVRDSCDVFAEVPILAGKKSDQRPDHPITDGAQKDSKNSWDFLSNQYVVEHEQCIGNILKNVKVEGFCYEALYKAIEHLSECEKHAYSRLIDSGVLKGISRDGIKRVGEDMILQSGYRDFLQKLIKAKEKLNVNDIHVLSFCCCADLIRAAFSAGGLHNLNIHSNEFCYEESISTGVIITNMEAPLDKIRTFKRLLKGSIGEGSNHITIYIGNSIGDLLCLLKADIGVVIGSSLSLRRLGAQFGVSFIPLFPGVVEKQRKLSESGTSVWKGLSGTLFTASSWEEVSALIFGS